MGHERIANLAFKARRARAELAEAMRAACPGPHELVARRGGQPPWCRACGYSVTGERVNA
jgi:predicted Zn-ribbon and HTH transcriptional regulator